jgi:hypothetical protein
MLDPAMDDGISDVAQQECQIDGSNMLPGASLLCSVPSRVQRQPALVLSRAFFKKQTRGEDTIMDFFLNMAQTVRTFLPFLQARVESKVFVAVNSAELLMYNLENPWKTSSTHDYLIPPSVYSNPLLGREPHVPESFSSFTPTPHIVTAVNSGATDSAQSHSPHQWDTAVNSPLSDPVDQKPAVNNLLSSALNSPSPSSESDPSCDMASSVRNAAEIRHSHK